MLSSREYLSDNISTERKIVFITCFFWLIAKLISWKVWTTYRLFPLVPPFDFLKNLPPACHLILFLVSIFCLAILVIKPSAKSAGILILSELLSLIADQTRWQPWEYQYLFTMLLFWLNKKRSKQFYSAVAFIMVCTYFYSGISKLNSGFLYGVWNNMIIHRFLGIKGGIIDNPILYHVGYLIGLIEILAGIGLVFKKSRKFAAVLLIVMHCFILVVLGPSGLNYNLIVWPWNIAMISYLYVLFINFSVTTFNIRDITIGWNKLVLVCWGFLPILNYFGWWDDYLSSILYAGKSKEMIICIQNQNNKDMQPLEPFYNPDYKSICDGDKMIRVTQWAISELKVPVYPEKRVYLKIKKSFTTMYPSAQSRFYLFTKSTNNKQDLK